ncbi:alpha/beta hydrolase [Plantibacter cousiniae (nom. nud.)]|uniref:alpha/beta hydrolase n=1 Tax=Plantibacter cousiniae (nom. nud.) TaxID=199709 RepID=UPI001D95FDA6|nr:alpha/beta fold hydrolase [Plantibacter cousiniae]CAH0191250.1 hypothetical protein SRABI02_01729 [Plantibacter cousiniae]
MQINDASRDEPAMIRLVARFAAFALLHPRRRPPHRRPSDHGVADWRSISVATDRGRLDGWLLHGRRDRLALVGHGIGLSRSASLDQAAHLHRRGYTVLLFDLRNHGRSHRDPSGTGIADRFTTDIEQAAQTLRADHGSTDALLLVLGTSFSTFPSLAAVARGSARIDALVCDSGPGLTLDSLFTGFFRAGFGPRVPGFRSPERRAALYRAIASDAVRRLGSSWPPEPAKGDLARTPMLFITGSTDDIMPPSEVRRLTDRYDTAQLVTLDCGHLRGNKDQRERYYTELDAFLTAVETVHTDRGAP